MSQFKKAFKGIDSAIKQGTARALNRALSSAKTKMVRALREDTSLTTEVIKTRTRGRKAAQNRLGISLGIAVKFGVALTKFTPKEKKVRVKRGGKGKAQLYRGITAKIGKGPRQLVPGAFGMDTKSKFIVAGRKQAFTDTNRGHGVYSNRTAPRKPTVQLKTTVFVDAAKANEAAVKADMKDTFNRIVAHEIDYAIAKQFKSNK